MPTEMENVPLGNENFKSLMSTSNVSQDSGVFMSESIDAFSPTTAPQVSPSTLETSNGTNIKKKKRRTKQSLYMTEFHQLYELKGEFLGSGSFGNVETCISRLTGNEYAVKIVDKSNYYFSRSKILKEIELYYWCRGQTEIIQLIDYFEDNDKFYLVFEKALGGPLLSQIEKRIHFSEKEASEIVKELATALKFLHEKGIAHRDLKPENILCLKEDSPTPIMLCDFDLCSSVNQTVSTPRLMSPVGSAEYMAPEVVEVFDFDDLHFDENSMSQSSETMTEEEDMSLFYDKRCDLWSLGVITYILLCGYPPFQGSCGQDCGWSDRGASCSICQQRLFSSIKNGSVEFHDQHWNTVSDEAKDLISKLLVKKASDRLNAGDILKHPWIVKGGFGSSTQSLETPTVLKRQQTVMDMSEFASNALAIKRNVENPYSFTMSAMLNALPSTGNHNSTNGRTNMVKINLYDAIRQY